VSKVFFSVRCDSPEYVYGSGGLTDVDSSSSHSREDRTSSDGMDVLGNSGDHHPDSKEDDGTGQGGRTAEQVGDLSKVE
jgi:hypothetical protein